jgi:hypothetical protein
VTGPQPGDPQPAVRPADGWLSVDHGVVGVQGAPPPSETIHLALHAAALTAHALPSVELLEWFSAHRHESDRLGRKLDDSSIGRVQRALAGEGTRVKG